MGKVEAYASAVHCIFLAFNNESFLEGVFVLLSWWDRSPGELCVLLISEVLLVLREHLLDSTGSCQQLAVGFVATTATLQMIWLQDGPGGPVGGVCQLLLGVILNVSIDIFILSSLYLEWR